MSYTYFMCFISVVATIYSALSLRKSIKFKAQSKAHWSEAKNKPYGTEVAPSKPQPPSRVVSTESLRNDIGLRPRSKTKVSQP